MLEVDGGGWLISNNATTISDSKFFPPTHAILRINRELSDMTRAAAAPLTILNIMSQPEFANNNNAPVAISLSGHTGAVLTSQRAASTEYPAVVGLIEVIVCLDG
jgi:hypothetical protein